MIVVIYAEKENRMSNHSFSTMFLKDGGKGIALQKFEQKSFLFVHDRCGQLQT